MPGAPKRFRLPDLSDYERKLSQTDRMDALGRPRSWSIVTQGFHPFSPDRIVVMPAEVGGWPDRDNIAPCADRMCETGIDRRIDEEIEDTRRRNPGYDPPGGWFPDSKRESIYWIMDVMTDHYGVRSEFEAWVIGLVGRELLGSTAFAAVAWPTSSNTASPTSPWIAPRWTGGSSSSPRVSNGVPWMRRKFMP